MKTSSSILPIAAVTGAGLLLYHFQGIGDAAKNLGIRVVDVKPNRPSGGKIKTIISLECANPGRSSIAIDFVDAEIRLGGALIGVINQNTFGQLRKAKPDYGVIKARSRSIISFAVTSSIAGTAIELILDFISSGLPKDSSIKGFVMAEGIRIPVSFTKPVLIPKA